jgi:PAS domain S-box-containing protein
MLSALYRLRILIPAIVLSGTLLLLFLFTFERMQEGEREILRSVTETARTEMLMLQNILSDNMIRGDHENAKQRLTYAALSPQIATLILTDANHTVLLANRQELVGVTATTISHFDKGLAEKAGTLQRADLSVEEQYHLHGYYPVTLGMRTGEIRPQQSGILYVEYDFGDRVNLLRHGAYESAARLAAFLFLFALLLSFLLHVLVTRPIDRLVLVVKEFAKGRLGMRVGVSEIDEINQLSTAFNNMATDLARGQEDLHLQNVQLEEEVAERQLVQEALEEQTLCLEEEISERRRAEEKLQIIFDVAQAGIIMVDGSGVITFANRCASQMFGFAPAEIAGSSYADHVHHDEREVSGDLMQKLTRGDIESISTERHYLRGNDRGDFWGLLSARQHLDAAGGLIAVVIVITDITGLRNAQAERDLLQQKFNQSQKMEAIGRLAGGVAHDFNNKLTVIMGYAELLKMKADKFDEDGIGRLNEILKAANHSQEITRQLLAFSRSEVISPHKINLNSVIEDSRKSLGRLIGEDISLKFKPAADLWPALLDSTQMDQIIMNLAVNARDAMSEGGLFEIETSNVSIDEAYCHRFPNARPGDYVQLSVSDTGCGMNSDTLGHIFEPFFTTKEAGKGTGLGLATIYGIVSQNNGFLHAYSEVGLGTTFKIYFPRLKVENGISTPGNVESAAISGSGTILLVEDEDSLLKLTSEMLTELGYTVLEAKLPSEALGLCAPNKNRKIDMILTDIIMPEMNGKEMSDRILEERPGIPVLFMSGYTADVIASKGILEKSVSFIQKPFTLQVLGQKIHEILSEQM